MLNKWLAAISLSMVLCSVSVQGDAMSGLNDKRLLQNVCALASPEIEDTEMINGQEAVIISYVGIKRKPQRVNQERDWGPTNIKWRIKQDHSGTVAVIGFEKLPETKMDLSMEAFHINNVPHLMAWKIGEVTIKKRKLELYTVKPAQAKDFINGKSNLFGSSAQKKDKDDREDGGERKRDRKRDKKRDRDDRDDRD